MNKNERKVYENLKKDPKFKNENEEIEFWSRNDSLDYVDYSKAKKLVFTNLRPSTKSISIRLPESLLQRLKIIANKKDVPYQSLIKMYLSEKVKDDLTH